MREPARLQAAIEILDSVIAAARTEGAAADTLVQRYFATRRYAGSKDRAAVRALVYGAIRALGDVPVSGRAAMLGYAEGLAPQLLPMFDGSPHAPAVPVTEDPRAVLGAAPAWLMDRLHARFGATLADETAALLGRAAMDLRINRLKTADVAAVRAALPVASAPPQGLPIPLPFALRLAEGVALDTHPLMQNGVIEVQDAGSQLVTALGAAQPGETVIDLCAGAGGKTLALAADMAGIGALIACDTDRGRLQAMAPRLVRAGADAYVEARLLNPGRESEQLADLAGKADLVLIDAPCSGTGTWRRNPELKWRLTEDRLARLVGIQARLMNIGASLVRPGGRLVYAVCSVLREEGEAQASAFALAMGARETARLALSPAANGCDGFFVASFEMR